MDFPVRGFPFQASKVGARLLANTDIQQEVFAAMRTIYDQLITKKALRSRPALADDALSDFISPDDDNNDYEMDDEMESNTRAPRLRRARHTRPLTQQELDDMEQEEDEDLDNTRKAVVFPADVGYIVSIGFGLDDASYGPEKLQEICRAAFSYLNGAAINTTWNNQL